MEDVTANAIKNERALEKESMMSCGGRGRFCVLEEEKAVLYFVEERDGWVRAKYRVMIRMHQQDREVPLDGRVGGYVPSWIVRGGDWMGASGRSV